MTDSQRMWLIFFIGRLNEGNARDGLRAVQGYWEEVLKIPFDTWSDFEKAVLRRDAAITLYWGAAQLRAMQYLAGPCPL